MEGISIDAGEDKSIVRSLVEHAKSQLPSFAADVRKFGWPPNFFTRWPGLDMPIELSVDTVYQEGAVVELSDTSITTIFVPLTSPLEPSTYDGGNCEIYVDVARREPCFTGTADDARKTCPRPREYSVTVVAGKSRSNVLTLRSRYSVEFGPAYADVSVSVEIT